MDTNGFETEAKLRREISALQEQVANLLDIQVRSEAYRRKVVEEYNQLELENKMLKRELRGLESDAMQASDTIWQTQPVQTKVLEASE